jgi:hypothetical protein
MKKTDKFDYIKNKNFYMTESTINKLKDIRRKYLQQRISI